MTRDTHVAVIGLGYVGLPLAISFAEAGLDVQGIDLSEDRIAALVAGRSPIDDISDERLTAALGGTFRVTTQADAHAPGRRCGRRLRPDAHQRDQGPGPRPGAGGRQVHPRPPSRGQLIVLQSTTFPGTTTGPFREVIEESGLRAGPDFDLAYAPERVNPGDPASAARAVPRLVGGRTPDATGRAAALLGRSTIGSSTVSSPDAAELAKLLENVFRNVNIAFVNQLALLCERMDLDVWEIIDAAATKPFGFMRFTPGPGVGGHCIPIDPDEVVISQLGAAPPGADRAERDAGVPHGVRPPGDQIRWISSGRASVAKSRSVPEPAEQRRRARCRRPGTAGARPR